MSTFKTSRDKKHTIRYGSVDLSSEFSEFVKDNKRLLKALSD